MLTQQYSDSDVEYMRTFKPEGDAYISDSKRVFDELKPLIIDGPSWTYVKPFGPKCDGRGAILDLKHQTEGSDASKRRESATYNLILSAHFRGMTRNFTLDHYIDVHASSHAELSELKEPVSEIRKSLISWLAYLTLS